MMPGSRFSRGGPECSQGLPHRVMWARDSTAFPPLAASLTGAGRARAEGGR